MNLFTWRFGRYIGAREISEGNRIPRGYGLAWYLPYSAQLYVMPIPFNWIAGWCRLLSLRLQKGPDDPIAQNYGNGYRKGYAEGYGEGRQSGIRSAVDIVKGTIRHVS